MYDKASKKNGRGRIMSTMEKKKKKQVSGCHSGRKWIKINRMLD